MWVIVMWISRQPTIVGFLVSVYSGAFVIATSYNKMEQKPSFLRHQICCQTKKNRPQVFSRFERYCLRSLNFCWGARALEVFSVYSLSLSEAVAWMLRLEAPMRKV